MFKFLVVKLGVSQGEVVRYSSGRHLVHYFP